MRELLVGGTVAILFLLLLFGCVSPQERAATPAGSDVGDKEIAVTEDEEDAPLYFEEEVPEPPEPPELKESEEPEEPPEELSPSDIDVFDESDFDIMMTEDIIEP